jgi:hypothetical protein
MKYKSKTEDTQTEIRIIRGKKILVKLEIN